jgi:predicted nucleic acid-binding protein
MSSSGASAASRQYQKPYLDASVYIGWIKGETNVKGVNRAEIAAHILRQAERGVFKIVISAWTLAEVHKPRGFDPLSKQQSRTLLRFFEREFFEFVAVDRLVGEHAHMLCQEHGIRPGDAVHLACAIRASCDVLLAWDGPLRNITSPPLPIEEPQMLGQAELPLLPTSG